MTFALFFGAGNLIFPPFIGYESGENLWIAALGFITTGVCFPLLGTISGTIVNGRLELLGKKVGKWFYVLFPIIIYLCIGPLFIIPRSASVTYTMGIEPFLSSPSFTIMVLVTGIYFIISGYFALNQGKMVTIIGKFITPALFIVIGIIVIKAMISPVGEVSIVTGDYVSSPYFKGFVEGFLTMDTLGALVVSNILVVTIKDYGISDKKDIVKYASIASLIAGVALTIIYASLSYVGSRATIFGPIENGGVLLTYVMEFMFGKSGVVLLGIVIALACISTSIGVTSASSRFFHSVYPRLSYKTWVIIITLISFLISNIGLNTLIKITVPVLTIIYPEAIIVILLSFIYKYISKSRYIYKVTVITALIISVVNTFDSLEISIPLLTNIFSYLPLYSVTLGWIVPSIILGSITYIFEMFYINKTI